MKYKAILLLLPLINGCNKNQGYLLTMHSFVNKINTKDYSGLKGMYANPIFIGSDLFLKSKADQANELIDSGKNIMWNRMKFYEKSDPGSGKTIYADLPLKVLDKSEISDEYLEFTFADYWGPKKILDFTIHIDFLNGKYPPLKNMDSLHEK